jgi:hypothetical protein
MINEKAEMTSVELEPEPDSTGPIHLELLTAAEICAMLRIESLMTLDRYIKAGLPVHQPLPGGRRLFDKAEVIAWLKLRWTAKTADQQASNGDPNGDTK